MLADSAQPAQILAEWVNAKYNLDRSPDYYQGKDVKGVYEELVKLNREYLHEGKLEEVIDQAIAGKSDEEAIAWGKERFERTWNEVRFSNSDGDVREKTTRTGARASALRIVEAGTGRSPSHS